MGADSVLKKAVKIAEERDRETRDFTSDEDMQRWFDESQFSPQNFRNNIIYKVRGDNGKATMFYSKLSSKRYDVNSITAMPFESSESADTLYISTATLNTMPCVLEELKGVAEEETDGTVKQEESIDCITIFGHNKDNDNRYNSRLDENIFWNISRKMKTKFKVIKLFGSFDNVDSMCNTIKKFYELLSDKDILSRVLVNLSSTVRDDDGKIRTVADMINSGYIKPEIVPGVSYVGYEYTRFPKNMSGPIFTGDYHFELTKPRELFK